MQNTRSVKVVEGGGRGFRMADVRGSAIESIFCLKNQGVTAKDLVETAVRALPGDNIAIAFSIAGMVDSTGRIVRTPNIPFLNGVPLGDMTREASKKPVIVGNDMETAATGMARIFPNLKYFAGITWSSGIGIRVVKNGLIVSDSEASHISLDRSLYAPLCGCGLRGCYDAVVGGNGIMRRVIAEAQTQGINLPEGMHPCTVLDRAYVAHEPWAVAIYQLITEGMGSFLATLQTILQVPAIVWKGSFAQKALRLPGIEELIRTAMRKHLANPEWETGLHFLFVPQPPDAIEDSEAFLGAAELALRMCG